MHKTWVVFFLMWLAYVWVWKSSKLQVDNRQVRAEAPTFRQNCTTKQIPCIDDCSFLCVDRDAQCIDGVCQSREETVPCKEETGGVLMLIKDPVPRWTCICTNSTFYRGPDCSELNKDVCEHGVFLYVNRYNFLCMCLAPYELVTIDHKPFCVEKAKARFIKETL